MSYPIEWVTPTDRQPLTSTTDVPVYERIPLNADDALDDLLDAFHFNLGDDRLDKPRQPDVPEYYPWLAPPTTWMPSVG